MVTFHGEHEGQFQFTNSDLACPRMWMEKPGSIAHKFRNHRELIWISKADSQGTMTWSHSTPPPKIKEIKNTVDC